MKPKTKIEKEVDALSGRIPPITEHQLQWAERTFADVDTAYENSRRAYCEHFIIVTTFHGWQVLRHFYIYFKYAYKRLKCANTFEVMQEWLRGGEYVFIARDRVGIGYANDAWQLSNPMSIKRSYDHCSTLNDPRGLGYAGVLYVNRTEQFKYLPKDKDCNLRIGDLYRSVNVFPYSETLLRLAPTKLSWCIKEGFSLSKEKMAAVKIAMRYNVEFCNPFWKDLIEMLVFLGKDTHNPKFVCLEGQELKEAHDLWMILANRKRAKLMEIQRKAQQVREEKRRLLYLQQQEQRLREEEQRKKTAVSAYKKKRERFFGMIIAENELEITVLKTLNEFFEEGKAMNHCVFSNAYYDVLKRPNCLILSAKVNGERAETIEIDLSDYHIVQSRGKYNHNSPYHEQILGLMNRSMDIVKQYNKVRV